MVIKNNCTMKAKAYARAYEGIFDALGTAVIYYDHQGYLLSANTKARQILPHLHQSLSTLNELISFVFECSLDSEDQTSLSVHLHDTDEMLEFTEVIQLSDDEYYLVRARAHHNEGMIVELSDISLIKKKTDNIRLLDRDNKILSDAIHSSQKGIFIAKNNERKEIIFASRAMDDLLDIHSEQLIGYELNQFLAHFFVDEWPQIQVSLMMRQNGKFWQKIDLENGRFKWLSIHLCTQLNGGNEDMIVGFISDETTNKINEHHFLQTQKMEAIGKLAGGVAHDFNNILSIVDGYIRLSEAAIGRGEDISENFARIKKAVQRGSGLTKQLLTFGKHRVSENKIINLCAHVYEVETLLIPLLGAGFNLYITVPDKPVMVRASADSVSQIIMNLVINARDAMSDGGDIHIDISEHQDDRHHCAILKVVDTGCGMSPDIVEKIFDPFFTTKPQGKGTGLGLSMVYGILQQIGAEVFVSSVVGEGTSFTIHLPIAEGHEFVESEVQTATSKADLAGKTVLLAEDEEDLRTIIQQVLEDFGMKVLAAKNGQDALVLQDDYQEKIDFLLTDMVMPELGGLKLASLMKEVRPETNILFMSGYPVRGDISTIELPSDAIFMAKPVQPDFLRNLLQQVASGECVNSTDANIWQA